MNRSAFVVSILALVFTSCSTLQPLSYERLCPAEIFFSEQVRTVGVVNNMPAVHQDYKQVDYTSASLEGDGSISVEVLAQEVASADYFDQVVVYDKKIRKNTYPLDQPISKESVDELLRVLDVDMLLSMERVNVVLKDTTMIVPDAYIKVPVVDGIVTSVVRAYLPQRDESLFTIQNVDTLCWVITPDLTYYDIVKEVSEYAATMPIKKLLPYWTEMQRFYFDGGGVEMRDAGVYVRERNWEAAARLWKQVLDKKKGKARMCAAYNLALYCEMKDDFEEAREYLSVAASCISSSAPENQLISFYRMQIDELLSENRALRLQMKRFIDVF